jgi:hypothetical protein
MKLYPICELLLTPGRLSSKFLQAIVSWPSLMVICVVRWAKPGGGSRGLGASRPCASRWPQDAGREQILPAFGCASYLHMHQRAHRGGWWRAKLSQRIPEREWKASEPSSHIMPSDPLGAHRG